MYVPSHNRMDDRAEQLAFMRKYSFALKLQGIVAFEIAVTRIEARWKLSQDHLPQERRTIVEALARSADSAAVETAVLTRKLDPAR